MGKHFDQHSVAFVTLLMIRINLRCTIELQHILNFTTPIFNVRAPPHLRLASN